MSENVGPAKTKSQLRAERRAVQEAQRAAKAADGSKKPAATNEKQQQRGTGGQQARPTQAPGPTSSRKKTLSGGSGSTTTTRSRSRDSATTTTSAVKPPPAAVAVNAGGTGGPGRMSRKDEPPARHSTSADVHPAFEILASKFDPVVGGTIRGSDAQCLATIQAFIELASSYHPPDDKSFSREFENAIKPCISRISGHRSLPPAIASLVKQMKLHLSTISSDTPENQARESIIDWLEDFADRNILLSTRAIAEAVTLKMKTMGRGGAAGPLVIMIYTYSATVDKTLMEAHRQGVVFEVVVVDSSPQKDGLLSVRRLTKLGVKCRYVLLTGISALLPGVHLVLLGAEGLLANGNVIAPSGSSQVAMTANARNVPVLVLCHTYKFCDKVALDSNWPNAEVMPAEFVDGVVTELRTLPCSAVPAVLRVKQLGGGIS